MEPGQSTKIDDIACAPGAK